MSLSQPSRTIVVEPVQASTASAPAAPPLGERPRPVEPNAAPSPPAQSPAGR